LCHPLSLDKVDVDIELVGAAADDGDRAATSTGATAVIRCECRVSEQRTGVEMEALTGASIAALTVYDMCKAVSHRIRIERTVLLHKSGGKRTVNVTPDDHGGR